MTDEFAISVRNLSKKYHLYESPQHRLREALHPFRKKFHRDFWALNDVSFDVPKGSTWGILGRNGSGKSTLLQLICGVLQPTAGSVATSGRISALLELGAGFNPNFTGRENVYMNGSILGLSRQEMDGKFEGIASFADIGEFIEQPVKTYSSGMYVRLAFAVAINVEPEILIVDEALAVGDMMFQAKCRDKIKALMESGVTTLFVTHDMNTVNTLCDAAIMLDEGQVFTQGKAQLVTLQYYQFMREREHAQQAAAKAQKSEEKRVQPGSGKDIRAEIKGKTTEEDYRYGTGAARIVEYAVLNSKKEEVNALRCGETFTVKIRAEFNERIENPCFGFTISNIAGQNLLAVHTFLDAEIPIGPKEKGDIVEVEMETAMLLNPGRYLLSIGIAEHRTVFDFTNIDARKNISTIEVFGKEYSSGMVYHQPVIRVSGNGDKTTD
jgi:ABC-type polysaccharide/polyol phosphate transport system ATPase subunit